MPTGSIPRILLAGGGTGGHVYPAIAIADAIRTLHPDAEIMFAGTKNRIEWKAVPAAGYRIEPITVSGIQRKLTVRNLAVPFKLLRGMQQSRRLIRSFRPDVTVGTGGYVSGPVLWMAEKMGCPTVIQEQNAFPGKTNLFLAKKARQIHIAFPEARDRLPAERCRLSGNPVRAGLAAGDVAAGRTHFGLAADGNVLLVFGGSLGSAALNAAMLAAAAEIIERPGLSVLWQTGSRYYERYREAAPDHDRLRVVEYIDRMDLAYAAADVVVCRSGAITCSELEVTATPAILVPSPNVAEDHQTWNARSLADDGAAVLLPEAELDTGLVSAVRDLLADRAKRESMKRSLARRARPAAAENIAISILELVAGDAK